MFAAHPDVAKAPEDESDSDSSSQEESESDDGELVQPQGEEGPDFTQEELDAFVSDSSDSSSEEEEEEEEQAAEEQADFKVFIDPTLLPPIRKKRMCHLVPRHKGDKVLEITFITTSGGIRKVTFTTYTCVECAMKFGAFSFVEALGKMPELYSSVSLSWGDKAVITDDPEELSQWGADVMKLSE
jgi:hypothetical protein